MMFFARPLQLLLVILLAGGAVTAGVVVEIARSNARIVQDKAQHAIGDTLAQVDTLLQRYQHGLAGVRGAFAVTGPARMDRAAFLRYSQSRDDKTEFPGLRGLGFIRRVAPDTVDAYVTHQRRSGWPEFALRQFQPYAGERAIIEVIEPIGTNQSVIGLDIASDPVRRAGATDATASGKATLTAPLKLLLDRGTGAQSFLMLLPVYDTPDGAAAPTRTVAGWAFAPLFIGEVLQQLPDPLPDGAFSLADDAPGRAPLQFYAAGTGEPDATTVHLARRMMGREWVATFQPSSAFVDALRLPRPMNAGLVGAVLTLLCAALGAALAAERARLRRLHASQEQLVIDRTGELESARRNLRTILDAVPSLIGYYDDQQRIRFANRAYSEWFRLPQESLVGRSMQDLLGAELYGLNECYVHAALRGERSVFERIATGPDGIARNFLANYLPDVSEGRVQGFYVLIHDVSEVVTSRQALASALRENDVLVRTINERMLYSVNDADGIILEVNDNFCAAYGYRRDELIGVHHRVLNQGQNDRAFWADMRETVTSGLTWHGTLRSQSTDGTAKWFDTVVAPYFNEHGVIERYVALHTDVTARHETDTALRHVSALLGNVLQAASEISMIATDTQGLITVFNSGAERMLGYTAAEMVGRSTAEPLHDSVEVAARAAELSRELGEPVAGMRTLILTAERDGFDAREWTYVRRDGSRFPVLLTVTNIRDDSGALLGFLGIAVDISQRKRDDAILHESIQRAEQASIAKSQFVANMSHEIRTPMNAMLGMLALTLRTDLSTRQRDYVDKARGAGATLLALLNDVLDFSKIEAGKLELDQHVFAVDVLLRDLAAVLTGNSANNQVELMFDIDPAIPARLLGDRQRIQQVLVNLAGNALKFTHAGNVVVEMTVLAEEPGAIILRLSVTDTGIGIPASQLGMIFDGFTQAEASTARRFGGTGLGLAISARIVALMGGQLQVSSEPGSGSRFWCDITLATAPDEGLATPPPLIRRALIVDDNPRSGAILQRLVERSGASASFAADAQQAVQLLTGAAASGRPFDVVLMDWPMPGTHDLAAAAMQVAGTGSAIPVIIVSALGEEEVRQAVRGSAAPFCALLSKPVTPLDLTRALARATSPPDDVVPVARAQRQRRLAGVRLLVVEDNSLNRQVAFELLSADGALVDLAEGGQQGVDMALDPARAYDAVIMDVQMPDVDGLEATRRIRAAAGPVHLPIMAMTANVSNADRDACLEAGMDSHIGKPFDIDEVVARLRGLIDGNVTASQQPAPAAARDDAAPLVDLAGALPRFFDDASLYGSMLDKFERDSGQLLARLAVEQSHADARAEAATLHALKGMALTMGVTRLAHVLTAPVASHWDQAAISALTAISIAAAREALAQCVD